MTIVYHFLRTSTSPQPSPGDPPAETLISMKVHCKEDDVEAIDVQLSFKDGVVSAVDGRTPYIHNSNWLIP